MEYFKIGKLVASTGLDGSLILQHNLGKKTALAGLNAIFLDQNKTGFLPYFIERAVARTDNEIIIKLEGIDIVENARKLTPKEVWITEEAFKKYSAKSAPISFLGFHIISTDKVDHGPITEIIEMVHQLLCTVIVKGKEALIPVHEKNLIKVDQKNRQLYVDIPDGLLEIYTD